MKHVPVFFYSRLSYFSAYVNIWSHLMKSKESEVSLQYSITALRQQRFMVTYMYSTADYH